LIELEARMRFQRGKAYSQDLRERVFAAAEDGGRVEQAFAKLKALLRARALRTVEALWKALGNLLDCFTPAECAAFLRHAGYFQSALNAL
jgi:hypothetical protein